MGHLFTRSFLLTMIFTASVSVLQAQQTDENLSGGDQPGLMTDHLPGLGHLLPVHDLLSTEENLATEYVPDLGGSLPVDGGLSLLLAAGAVYGVSRLRRSDRRV